MYTLYNLFKFLHVAAVIVWIGGVCTLGLLNLRLSREQDGAMLAALSRQGGFYGRAVLGPAAILTLIAGIATTASAGFGFDTLWIMWGFAGVFASLLLGGTLIRRTTEALGKLATTTAPGDPHLKALQRRLAALNLLNLLLLSSTVWAMVFKPML